MKKKAEYSISKKLIVLVLCLSQLLFLSCNKVTDQIEETNKVDCSEMERRILRTIKHDKSNFSPDTIPDGLDIRLEFVSYSPYEMIFKIHNNSNYNISYLEGLQLSGQHWGTMGVDGESLHQLKKGKSQSIIVKPMGVNGFELGYGEFLFTTEITVKYKYPAVKKSYKLHCAFALENIDIPQDLSDVALITSFESPIGLVLTITNGNKSGRLYYDKSFKLKKKKTSGWQELSTLCSEETPDDYLSSIGFRKRIEYFEVYWQWLYGALKPGKYRLEKDFWLLAEDGSISQQKCFVEFSLDGKLIPEDLVIGDTTWAHPFYSINSLRARVVEHLDNFHFYGPTGNLGLLVRDYPSKSEDDLSYIWNSQSVTTVLDIDGKQITFSEIPINSIIDISYNGMVLLSYPPHIGAILIRVIEE